MYEVSVEKTFAAAHRIVGYPGDCANIHGHTWKVVITIGNDKLNEQGMVVDFRYAKRALDQVLANYDHKYLNEVSPFDKTNPTAENIAYFLYQQLKGFFHDCRLKRVTVWESETSSASFQEG